MTHTLGFDLLYSAQLFKIHSSGQIGDWKISVSQHSDGSALVVRASTKILGGRPVTTPTHVTAGKNIGRSNETTPCEQAVLEAKSKYQKQLDKGYVIEMPVVGDTVTNSLGFVKPMLAQPIEKVKQWDFPVHASPKFDGHRMLATVVDEKVVLYSRGGKPIDVEHLRNALQATFDEGSWDGTTLDGEIYLHGATLQTISSLVKKPKPESKELVYHVYDIAHDKPFGLRYFNYSYAVTMTAHPKVNATMQIRFHNQEQLDAYHAKNLSEGYEGTMVRHGDTGYEDGKRSQSLMKMKDFQDAEFEIVSIRSGKPYIKPSGTFQVPVYTCKTPDSNLFECTAPGTMQEKHAAWENRDGDVGKMLTVKFFNFTPDGKPFLPVALQIKQEL